MRKITLFFAALLVALGITAQTTTYPEGYFDFATEYLTMEECDQNATFGEGMLIAIQHNHSFHTDATEGHDDEGKFLIMETKETSGVHKMIMNDHLSGLGAFTLVKADGGFKLKTVRDGHWVGKLSTTADNLKTTKYESDAGVYKFTWHEGFGYSVDCVNASSSSSSSSSSYSLYVNTSNGTTSISGGSFPSNIAGDSNKKVRAQVFFKIHKVSNPKGVTKYVENAKVELTGPGGNVFTTTHSGWSDFYEFVQNSAVYNSTENFGVTLSNVMYHEATNEITGNIHFPFSVSGDVVKIPVVLNPAKNTSRRIAANEAGDGLKVQTNSADVWVADTKNQWGIIPHFVNGFYLEYAIQNVATGKYITVDASNNVTLGADPYYFKLTGGTSNGEITDLRFKKNSTSSQFLYDNNGTVGMNYYASEGAQFKVDRVPANELSGADAKGFTRYYKDKLFWDCGVTDWSKAPKALLAVAQMDEHEGFNQDGHTLYSAETGCRVPKTGDITVTFNHSGGIHMLQILGVDVVAANGTVLNFDYHIGRAGDSDNSVGNTYTVTNIPAGENYTIRYWVCDYSDGHDLTQNQGNIVVTGADYYVKYSNAPANGAWAANTTWFRMRLHDDCTRYISAQPAYMDANNNLKLTNDTPPTDYAGMWAIVGDATNGYKFYNHAWGPEYALKTTGANAAARTFMAPVDEATTYDIVSGSDYKFYVKVHGSANNYLNMNGGDYGSKHLMTWNDKEALGDGGSVMTFETVNMEAFEANTESVKNTLAEKWMPWAAEPEVAPIIGDFAQLMLNRNSFALLDGKVFKFANQGNNNRTGKLLGVNASNKGAGLTATGNSEDYMQFIDNGNGTFKLFHIATARYLGLPGDAVTTTKSSEAAAYTYTFQDANNKEQLTFQTSGQTLHLQNSFELMNYGNDDDASRWIVSYDENAQELGAVAIEAQEMLEEITSEEYLAKAGQQGYASRAQIEAYQNAIQGLSGKSVAEAMSALETSMNAIEDAEKNNALETAKAEATALLNDTPETVGYPVAAERTTFANAIVAASDISTIEAAVQVFKTTTNVNMPESGKAYVIRNVHPNGTTYMLTSGYEGDAPQLPTAGSNVTNANIFICRGVTGGYVFVNAEHGKYMLFHGKSGNYPLSEDGFSLTYSDDNILKINSQTGKRFGTLSIAGLRTEWQTGNKAYATMTINKNGNMDANGGENNPSYTDTWSSLFIFEEVPHTFNQVSLATIQSTDKLLIGSELEGKTISTFSAPYPTDLPDGVTAYYAAEAEKAGELILKPVDGVAIPGKQGVVLIGNPNTAKITMLPAIKTVATISDNVFEHSATGPVEMGDNAYILANGGQGIGIYKATAGSTLKQGKAYLNFTGSSANSFVLNFSGVTTDIEGAPTVAPSQQVIYDLSGRRVNAVTKGGIYIVNGKKMIIK